MRAGKLRHFIILEREVQVDNGIGGFTTTFVKFRGVWARIQSLRGREIYEAHQTKAIVDHRVTIRRINFAAGGYFGNTYWGDNYFGRSYWGGADVDKAGSDISKMEVKFSNKAANKRFRIHDVRNHEERNELLILDCQEIPS